MDHLSQLFGWHYDAAATAALNLPGDVDGAAFKKEDALRYVLWAKTATDQSESAGVTISLTGSYDQVTWDGTTSVVAGNNLALTGAPNFLTPQ